MKWIIRIGVIMFAVFCGIKAVPEEKASSGDITSTSIRYVALGDSIAYGYGLSDRKEQSYVELIRKNLETKYDSVFVTNFGENGMQSGEQIRKERNIKSTGQRLNMPILLRYPLAQMIYSI